MAHVSDDRFLVAHGLRLKGFAQVDIVAAIVGVDARIVGTHLDELKGTGHVQFREGRITGWSLTTDGREHHRGLCAAELEASGSAASVDGAYRRFLQLNEPFLAVCTDWQLREGATGEGPQVLNDHTDPAYDESVIARLVEIDCGVEPVIGDLAGELARFAPYGPRLAEARKRVESGERDWFTGAMIESYHTIWFELHEDLLATLGIERSKETT